MDQQHNRDQQLPNEPVDQRYTSDNELIHRFSYHAPGPAARAIHEEVREEFKQLALTLNELLPEGRSKSLAFTALEEASFHAHAAIARDPGVHADVTG